MNLKVRLGLYAVLVVMTAWFGHTFYANYEANAGGDSTPVKIIRKAHKKEKPAKKPTTLVSTNGPASDTNAAAVDTNALAATTNATEQATNAAETAVASANTPAPASGSDTNQASATSGGSDQTPTSMNDMVTGKGQGTTVVYLALFVVSALGLGIMIAHDVTHLIGGKAGDYLYDNVADKARDPEYEKAEQVWVDGKHLEAIQMLRDYYKRNPKQVHAALRIAEIYEKDLGNHLAAALEYEEVLKHKLPGDRWSRAAVHLCNLYSRIGQQDKMTALLERIAKEHPNTVAAKKARQRLSLPEPEETEQAEPELETEAEDASAGPFNVSESKGEWPSEPTEQAAPESPVESDEPKSNLPPGFRPKK